MADPPIVTLVLTNRSARAITLVLEPVGETYAVDPGEARIIRYCGDPAPELSIDIHDRELKIWEEGVGTLELEA